MYLYITLFVFRLAINLSMGLDTFLSLLYENLYCEKRSTVEKKIPKHNHFSSECEYNSESDIEKDGSGAKVISYDLWPMTKRRMLQLDCV